MSNRTMRAIRFNEYGGTEVLELEEIREPLPESNEVQVEVKSASVNPVDVHFRRGTYKVDSLPKKPGSDFAGIVKSTGEKVNEFKEGDRVFGTGIGKSPNGSYAEYLTVDQTKLARLPDNILFNEGAGIALVGVTAYRALISHGKLEPKDSVLIHGGNGGVGHVAIQLAKSIGADVLTTVGSDRYKEKMEKLGADFVFNYNSETLKKDIIEARRPNLILDHMLDKYLEIDIDLVSDFGKIIGIGETDNVEIKNPAVARNKELNVSFMSMFNTPSFRDILRELKGLMDKNKVRPILNKSYRLEEAAEAQRKIIEDSFLGKLIIKPQKTK
ncbi:MAG: NADPH:quinone reductase Qor [Candidatus Methanohalarchaeum thermophilum]|uniref:NADPH:quinone reductase Qor n=1 Tax=Methanohalarchaeum thermophilum TaxID=1903181 RepID=A0A1Q6DW85_METT1|nr:MAG: NADPH:quinone reductase Qor [Candidatus Methanohalarchaeum thermophilum]